MNLPSREGGLDQGKPNMQAESRGRTIICLTAALLASPAFAQTTPGSVTDTLKPPPKLESAPAPAPVQAEKPKQAPAPAGARGKTVNVTGFVFSGVTQFTQGELASRLQGYMNRPVTLVDIYTAADEIAEFYSSQGYTLASVNVPPQKISGGVVLLEVTEGQVARVSVENNSSHKNWVVQRFLGVRDGDIYKGEQIERGMQRLNELPGLSARAVIKPGEQYGSSELVVRATETPVSGALFIDNYGTEAVGRARFAATVNINNPSGMEDQVQLLALTSEESLLKYYYGAYSLPLNFMGSRLAFSYGHADFEVNNPALPGVSGKSRNGKIELQHPVLRSRTDRLSLSAGLSRTLSNADLSGTTFNGTSITLFEVGASYNHTYSNLAVTQVNTSLASNFDKQGFADTLPPPPPASPIIKADQRIRAEVDVIHHHPLVRKLSALVRLNTVWSPDPLPDVTKFSIGGPQSVRGFAPSELRGDRGFFTQIAVQQRYELGPARITGRVFADSGKVFCADGVSCTPSGTREDSLSSIGIGADAEFGRMHLKLDLAFPRDNHPASDGEDDGRLYGALFVNF